MQDSKKLKTLESLIIQLDYHDVEGAEAINAIETAKKIALSLQDRKLKEKSLEYIRIYEEEYN